MNALFIATTQSGDSLLLEGWNEAAAFLMSGRCAELSQLNEAEEALARDYLEAHPEVNVTGLRLQ